MSSPSIDGRLSTRTIPNDANLFSELIFRSVEVTGTIKTERSRMGSELQIYAFGCSNNDAPVIEISS